MINLNDVEDLYDKYISLNEFICSLDDLGYLLPEEAKCWTQNVKQAEEIMGRIRTSAMEAIL